MKGRRHVAICAAWVWAILAAALPAAEPRIGLLIPRDAAVRMDRECGTAGEIAQRQMAATVLVPETEGRFVDADGRAVSLGGLDAIWCHHGQTAEPAAAVFAPETLAALRDFVAGGRGLWLSGGAVTLLNPLELDTLQSKPVRSAQDSAAAGLVPRIESHPVFESLDLAQGVCWMSNAAYPALAEFRLTASPPRGRILAQCPGAPDCPLVEYSLGKGRVLVLAWQLDPLYGHASSGYRRNWEQLASNVIRYLGNPQAWQPLVMPDSGRGVTAEAAVGVSPDAWRSLELAIRDLRETYGRKYPRGEEFLQRLDALQQRHAARAVHASGVELGSGERAAQTEETQRFQELQADALLANPLLDFSQLLVVRRHTRQLGLPANYLGNSNLPPTGYDNQIALLSPVRPGGTLTRLYAPPQGEFVGDVRLDYDAQRLMFSMPNSAGRWRIFELQADGSALRQLPLIDEPDVDNYDACYLPDGRIVFSSTACFAGIPCVNGEGHVANLYLWEPGGSIRQLTVEQDHNWCPTVLNNGRVLYLRWEYSDLPHAFSRILFHMNPDGTEQMEYYGSNSYWPAAMFYARAIPQHPTKVVAVASGHHGVPRMGELVIFDPARGRREAQGAVQRIPGHGRPVEPAVLDQPADQRWPRFLHPHPLSDKHFLVSCQPHKDALWGIYLVDTFDNAVLLAEEPGYALFEPLPLRPAPRPPCLADKVDLARADAQVLIADIYRGEGLRGVPRGSIKSLRVTGYHFAYQGMGAEPYSVGLDGPWDPKRILGTVPVAADGSAHFRVPANTPFALQPLDAEGRAVQLMRTWITAMPGEVVSCVGCHEPQNTAPPVRQPLAANQPPAEIEPWYGPARGFAFRREVQPVLDRYCTECHHGRPLADGQTLCSFEDGENAPVQANANRHNQEARFSPSYYQLRRFVRTPCKESDMHLLNPWEYHADTTRLVQLLQKGHYGVQLDAESWDRLITWIDLNAPFHGDWFDLRGDEIGEQVRHQAQRRAAMRQRYAGTDGRPEETPVEYAITKRSAETKAILAADGAAHADSPAPPAGDPDAMPMRAADLGTDLLTIPLSPDVSLELVHIPAGGFVMGQQNGCDDERPARPVTIEQPFCMGRFEVTNEQFALFDPTHDSRWENNDFIKFGPGELGWTLARPRQPVVRVSWTQATAFCDWLSQRTGRTFRLPSEAQWEYACRAGSQTPLWYGGVADDFSAVANVADRSHQQIDPFGDPNRSAVIAPWRPADPRFDDHSRVSALVGSYQPNPWGLFDMHGNVAEWTRSAYRPHGVDQPAAGPGAEEKRVVRGGSWYDPPARCRAASRQAYRPEQPVYDVGFRVICE